MVRNNSAKFASYKNKIDDEISKFHDLFGHLKSADYVAPEGHNWRYDNSDLDRQNENITMGRFQLLDGSRWFIKSEYDVADSQKGGKKEKESY